MGMQFTRRLACFCLGIAMTGATFALPARAAEPDATEFLRTFANDAVTVLGDDSLDRTSRAHAFRQLLRRGFDLPAVSRFVLGRYWRQADSAQRDEFTRLFEDYMVATYSSRFADQRGNTLTVTSQNADSPDKAIVHSNIERQNGPAISLDWRLVRRDGAWRVVDIMVEGVSLALAQRSEFASVIRNGGGKVSGLISKLRQKSQTLAMR